MDRRGRVRRRLWADVLAIVAGVAATLMGIWMPQALAPGSAAADVGNQQVWWYTHFIAGPLALLAVLVAHRSRTAGRAMLAVAGLVLLGGLLAFRRFDAAILLNVLPGLMMLLAAPFLGPMPSPEEEGRAA